MLFNHDSFFRRRASLLAPALAIAVIFFGPARALAASAPKIESLSSCCGESLNLILEFNFHEKKVRLQDHVIHPERMCREKDPAHFGNGVIEISDRQGKILFRLKTLIPLPALFYDEVDPRNAKTNGGVRELATSVQTLKVPRCFEPQWKQMHLRVMDLQNHLVAEGDL